MKKNTGDTGSNSTFSTTLKKYFPFIQGCIRSFQQKDSCTVIYLFFIQKSSLFVWSFCGFYSLFWIPAVMTNYFHYNDSNLSLPRQESRKGRKNHKKTIRNAWSLVWKRREMMVWYISGWEARLLGCKKVFGCKLIRAHNWLVRKKMPQSIQP